MYKKYIIQNENKKLLAMGKIFLVGVSLLVVGLLLRKFVLEYCNVSDKAKRFLKWVYSLLITVGVLVYLAVIIVFELSK